MLYPTSSKTLLAESVGCKGGLVMSPHWPQEARVIPPVNSQSVCSTSWEQVYHAPDHIPWKDTPCRAEKNLPHFLMFQQFACIHWQSFNKCSFIINVLPFPSNSTFLASTHKNTPATSPSVWVGAGEKRSDEIPETVQTQAHPRLEVIPERLMILTRVLVHP